MLFNSQPFLILLVVALAVYYLPPARKLQVYVLIAASFVFYSYHLPILLLLLLVSILINAVCSFFLFREPPGKRRRIWAMSGVAINLGILGLFKYSKLFASLLAEDISKLSGVAGVLVALPLPIGISFYTFQGVSLVVDSFRENDELTKVQESKPFPEHLRDTSLFVSFFPQLIAGPIVRSHEFYRQIVPRGIRDVDWSYAAKALVVGYFLKSVIADNLHDSTFWIAYPYFEKHSTFTLLTLLFGYSFQIFADFAGYSLIAVGLGALFGYRLPINFNFPYIAASFSEFWRRWHITLSTWLRDYLYIPLGGNKRGPIFLVLNLFIVMFLGGLWHGAAWSYAVWGTCHGLVLMAERPLRPLGRFFSSKPMIALRMLFVFVVVSFAWLLFKLPEFDHVIKFLQALERNYYVEHSHELMVSVLIYSTPVVAYHIYYLLESRFQFKIPRILDNLTYALMLFLIIHQAGTPHEFIYFQF